MPSTDSSGRVFPTTLGPSCNPLGTSRAHSNVPRVMIELEATFASESSQIICANNIAPDYPLNVLKDVANGLNRVTLSNFKTT